MDPTHPRLSAKVLNMRLGMKEAGDRVHDQLSQESRLVSSRQQTTSTTRNLWAQQHLDPFGSTVDQYASCPHRERESFTKRFVFLFKARLNLALSLARWPSHRQEPGYPTDRLEDGMRFEMLWKLRWLEDVKLGTFWNSICHPCKSVWSRFEDSHTACSHHKYPALRRQV